MKLVRVVLTVDDPLVAGTRDPGPSLHCTTRSGNINGSRSDSIGAIVRNLTQVGGRSVVPLVCTTVSKISQVGSRPRERKL